MRSLRLSGKKLQNLPDFSKMTKLQVINFLDYPMSVLPFSSFLPFSRLNHISLDNLNLTSLPSDLYSLKMNRVFSANRNHLIDFPDINTLEQLDLINLHSNLIANVPDLSALVNVEMLFLSKNKIKYLPNINHMKKLFCLNLRENMLETLPAIDQLTELEVLDLRKNNFTGNFTGYENLINIQFLGLGDSGFSYDVNDILNRLPHLRYYEKGYFLSQDPKYWYWGYWDYYSKPTSSGHWGYCYVRLGDLEI